MRPFDVTRARFVVRRPHPAGHTYDALDTGTDDGSLTYAAGALPRVGEHVDLDDIANPWWIVVAIYHQPPRPGSPAWNRGTALDQPTATGATLILEAAPNPYDDEVDDNHPYTPWDTTAELDEAQELIRHLSYSSHDHADIVRRAGDWTDRYDQTHPE